MTTRSGDNREKRPRTRIPKTKSKTDQYGKTSHR